MVPSIKIHPHAFPSSVAIPAGVLKCWYLSRFFDEEGTGACIWDIAKVATILGVYPATVYKYMREAINLGLFRVCSSLFRQGKTKKGFYYIRYSSLPFVRKKYNFSTNGVVEIPISYFKTKDVREIGVIAMTAYGQNISKLAVEASHPKRRKGQILQPRSFLPVRGRSYIACNEFLPEYRGGKPLGTTIQYYRVGRVAFFNKGRECPPPPDGLSPLETAAHFLLNSHSKVEGITSAPLYNITIHRYTRYTDSGNTSPRILGHRVKGNHKYVYLDGKRTLTYGVSQSWVAHKLGVTQSFVSKVLSSFDHYQLRELVPNPEYTFKQLTQHENFDPSNPWITKIPYEKPKKYKGKVKEKYQPLVDDGFPPGIYIIQRADKLFPNLPFGYVLLRDTTCVYDFKGKVNVLKSGWKTKKQGDTPLQNWISGESPTLTFSQEELHGIDLSELKEKYLQMRKGILPYTSKDNFLKLLREQATKRKLPPTPQRNGISSSTLNTANLLT